MSEETERKSEFEGPLPQKRIKIVSAWNKNEKLEEKLNHILSCSVSLKIYL